MPEPGKGHKGPVEGRFPEEKVGALAGQVRKWRQLDSYHEARWVGIHVSWPRDLLAVMKGSEVRVLEDPYP